MGFTDADMEQAEYERIGAHVAQLEGAGVCCHLSAVGYMPEPFYPAQVGLLPGEVRCTDGCGATFASEDAWQDAVSEAVYS